MTEKVIIVGHRHNDPTTISEVLGKVDPPKINLNPTKSYWEYEPKSGQENRREKRKKERNKNKKL